MNVVSYILLFLVAVAFGYGIITIVRRKGRCSGCNGGCSGCSGLQGCAGCKTDANNGKNCGTPQEKGQK